MGQIFSCFTHNNLCCKKKSDYRHKILDDNYIHSYNRRHKYNYNYNYNYDDYGTCDL